MTAPGTVGVLMFVLAVILTASTGCERPPPATTPPAGGKLRFLALGDSYTIGESVSTAERWPVQLAVLLRGQGVSVADPVIVARTGWTTAELRDGIVQAKPQGPFDLVTLLI